MGRGGNAIEDGLVGLSLVDDEALTSARSAEQPLGVQAAEVLSLFDRLEIDNPKAAEALLSESVLADHPHPQIAEGAPSYERAIEAFRRPGAIEQLNRANSDGLAKALLGPQIKRMRERLQDLLDETEICENCSSVFPKSQTELRYGAIWCPSCADNDDLDYPDPQDV
jgi:hypothetical protein